MKRYPILTIALGAALAVCCRPAMAHPLGNFTINHLSRITVARANLNVRYVLDMAEIPTFALMRGYDPGGRMTQQQIGSWARVEASTVAQQLRLTIDGLPVQLDVKSASATTRRGAGGLPTLYMTAEMSAPLEPKRAHRLAYDDGTYAGRLGWKDVVVSPATEPTHELTAYPSALLGSPRSLTSVEISVSEAGGVGVRTPAADSQPSGGLTSAIRSNQLSDLLAKGTSSPVFVLLTLLVAVALGALHALEPGHGKTLLAVSLVGARATTGQAAILAGALTIAHTAGVLVLCIAIILLKGRFVPESIYPWITLISGIAIAAIGARAVARQIIARQPFAHSHSHGHALAHSHDHDHDHGSPHAHDDAEHARSHAIPGDAPLRFGPTVWAAMSGGVAPCPAALVVLFAALAQNAIVYGVVAIIFFSFGLAATLTGLGIGVVRSASWLSKRPQFDRIVRYGPLASAVVIAIIGSVMVGQGITQQGLPVSAPVVTLLTALAIAGYAFSHPLRRAHAVQTA